MRWIKKSKEKENLSIWKDLKLKFEYFFLVIICDETQDCASATRYIFSQVWFPDVWGYLKKKMSQFHTIISFRCISINGKFAGISVIECQWNYILKKINILIHCPFLYIQLLNF